jgi:3-(3-hydroxy-phenyl)propionate hydroxylase
MSEAQFDPAPRVMQTSVVIIGAGPTGLMAANLLGGTGIDTILLERNAGLSDYPKAIAIDDEGLRICQAAGLRDEILRTVLPGIHAYYLSGGRFLARVAPTGKRNGYPPLSSFHQPTFEATLLKGLERYPCVTVLFRHNVESFEQDEECVRLTVRAQDGTQLTILCAYVLACNGTRSSTRQALGIAMRPPGLLHGVDQRWLVVDCVNDDDPTTAAIFFCNPARPAVTIPAPGHRRRWEFMLLPGEREEDFLDQARIQALIQQARAAQPRSARDGQSGTPAQIIRQMVYTFHALEATRFSQGRVFLLGDAAHLMPPFAGQGMNSGLRDAHNLCWKIQMALQGRGSRSLLESYQQERAPHTAQMILLSSLLGAIITPTSRTPAQMRDFFFRGIANRIPALHSVIREMRVKPTPRYRRGFLIPGKSSACRALIGILLPQPHVRTQPGERVPLDDVLGNGFTLLRLYENPAVAFASLKDELWEMLGVRRICVLPSQIAGSATESCCLVVADSDGGLGAFLHQRRDIYVMVRPDRYVLGAFHVTEAGQFEEKLARLLSE